MPAYTLFIETASDRAGKGIRRALPVVSFDAEDEVAAERQGRVELGWLVMLGAKWVRVLVVSSPAGELVAEFRHPDRTF